MTVPTLAVPPADPGVLDPWRPDSLVVGFECRDLVVGAAPAEGERDEPLVGTLIRRADPALRVSRRAVLYVHGWNDYFFQLHVAQFWESLGFAFHAVDLRRSGRSYRPGQFHGYVDSLDDYAVELDAAAAVIAASHDELVVVAHSTGGLSAALWLAGRPGRASALVLNSPWLDMFGPPALPTVIRPVLGQWNRRQPTAVLPWPENDGQVYARALHRSFGNEWDWSFDLKSPTSRPIRVGWLRAVLAGHRRVGKGLGLSCPVLVLTSARTDFVSRTPKRAREADIVLDVDRIAAAAWHLGPQVTLVRVEGGVHDLSLSPEPARTRFFTEIATWVRAYAPARTSLPLEE